MHGLSKKFHVVDCFESFIVSKAEFYDGSSRVRAVSLLGHKLYVGVIRAERKDMFFKAVEESQRRDVVEEYVLNRPR